MLRFPNPGSTIENFVHVYTVAFEHLDGRVVGLDDIVGAVVEANLATSSGYMGAEAVARSTRPDRSRDPLYNQLKMYAELFRTLGWLHPTPGSSLHFTFTLLGQELVAAGRDYLALLEECVLGIAYPTRVLTIMGDFDLRPFAFLLKVMRTCGDYLSRDEMIIGPLSTQSDRVSDAVTTVSNHVAAARENKGAIAAALQSLATQRRTQVNTLHNYTRWPIAVLRHCGWVEEATVRFDDGQSYKAFKLTEKGIATVQRIDSAVDLRLADVESLPSDRLSALAVVTHYQMLDRAGFDVSPVLDRVESAKALLAPELERWGSSGGNLLFSPFQSISIGSISAVFPVHDGIDATGRLQLFHDPVSFGRDDRSHLFVAPILVRTGDSTDVEIAPVRQELLRLIEHHDSPRAAAHVFAQMHSNDGKTEFYPLVTHLFRLMGFRSDHSRMGVNYQRWDACVWISDDAIPVEIKSPTEELYLSVKAVRQALENKIVLLSRGGLRTSRDLTSLVVGFKIPNERGDMSNLIDDVFTAFGLRLGVLDFGTVVYLAACAVGDRLTISPDQLGSLRGFLSV